MYLTFKSVQCVFVNIQPNHDNQVMGWYGEYTWAKVTYCYLYTLSRGLAQFMYIVAVHSEIDLMI